MTDQLGRLAAALADQYTIERELGAGGMATVYLAEDLKHHRQVAMKVLRPELAVAVGHERFLREIEIAARLRHPHILPLYDSGEADGFLFYVMPYVKGESLRDRLQREKQLAADEACRLAQEVADALGYAHGEGVVHRDIKPDNIMLESGHAVVADFGIARAVGTAGGEQLTATGVAVGTAHYMSPEQSAGDREIDGRTDIYALGCVLFEMLAGTPPFQGTTIESIVHQHIAVEAPPVTNHRPGVAANVASAIAKSLAKAPADRFVTTGDFIAALNQEPSAQTAVIPAARRSRTRLWGGIGVALVLVAAFILGQTNRGATGGAAGADDGVVAIFPFRVTGADPSLSYLREGMVDLLSAKFTGEPGPRALDPRAVFARWDGDGANADENALAALARDLGAGRLLLGELVGSPARISLNARLLDVDDGTVLARATGEGSVENVTGIADEVVVGILSAGEAGVDSERLRTLTTTSLPALQAFMRGEELYRRGQYEGAMREFTIATEIDTTFALAGYRLASAAGWIGGTDAIIEQGRDLAWRHRDRLGPRDMALFISRFGPRFPDPSPHVEYLAAREEAVRLVNESPTAWYEWSEEFSHFGRALGIDNWMEQALVGLDRAYASDSSWSGVAQHIVQFHALGDVTKAEEAAQAYLRHVPEGDVSEYVRWRIAEATGNEAAIAAFMDRLAELPSTTLRWMAVTSQDDGLSYVRARRIHAERASRLGPRAEVLETRLGALAAAANAGRPQEASMWFDRARAVQLDSAFIPRLEILHALYGAGDERRAARAATELEGSSDLSRESQCVLAQWHAWRGGTPDFAEDDPRRLRHYTCSLLVEAAFAVRTGEDGARDIVLRLDSAVATGPILARTDDGHHDFWGNATAMLLVAVGDSARALAAVKRRPYFNGHQHYFASGLLLEARLAAALGDTPGAREAYRHYLAFHDDPEPTTRSDVDAVRAEARPFAENGR